MESWLQLALVLEATTLAYAASVPQILGSPHFRQIMKAIDTYNTVLDTKSYFQLFSTELPHTQSGEMKLKFTIKETLCPRATQEDTQGCAFTDDGEVRNCTATFNGSDMRNLVLRCDTVTAVKIEEKNEEKEKSNNIDVRQMKKRSTKILSSNRKVNNSTTNSISCLQCIFDIFGTGV